MSEVCSMHCNVTSRILIEQFKGRMRLGRICTDGNNIKVFVIRPWKCGRGPLNTRKLISLFDEELQSCYGWSCALWLVSAVFERGRACALWLVSAAFERGRACACTEILTQDIAKKCRSTL